MARVHKGRISLAPRPTMATPNPPGLVNELDMALDAVPRPGRLVLGEGPAQCHDILSHRARFGFGDAAGCDFRIGERHAWYGWRIYFRRQAKQNGAHDEPRMMLGRVRGVRIAGDAVADRVDAPIAGAEMPIDDDTAGVMGDAGSVELERLNSWPSSSREEEMCAMNLLSSDQRDANIAGSADDPLDCFPFAHHDAVRCKPFEHDPGDFRILAAEGAAGLDDGHPRPRMRAIDCPSARPVDPAPMMMRCAGGSGTFVIVSGV